MINGSIAQDPTVPHTAQDPVIADTICISPVIGVPLLSLARCPATRNVNSSLACMARLPSQGRGIRALDTQGWPFVWFEDELEEKVAAAALEPSAPGVWVDLCEGLTGAAPQPGQLVDAGPEWGRVSDPKDDAPPVWDWRSIARWYAQG
jgi:hypothetical protein